jgi:hypothetical protein
VLDGADWVVMDTKPSTDANVLTAAGPALSGNDPDFERIHAVKSTVGWASGRTGGAGGYFRLGIRNSHAPTPDVPARYATVLLVEDDVTDLSKNTGNGVYFPASRLLYLRQGEGADYLFPERGGARKFATYNLTVPREKVAELESQGVVELDARGGVFADYPTQAGTMFQFAGPTAMWAFHPTRDEAPVPPFSNGIMYDFNPLTEETCPPGYRRPSAGTAGGEMLGSLWSDISSVPTIDAPDNGNVVMGYYADGWFDRRETTEQQFTIRTSGTGAAMQSYLPAEEDSAVEVDGAGVAYRGNLFFNRMTGASVFIPAAGMIHSTSYIDAAGNASILWSSSHDPDPLRGVSAYEFHAGKKIAWPNNPDHRAYLISWNKADAAPIRCVEERSDDIVALPPFDYLVGQFRIFPKGNDIDIAVMMFEDVDDDVNYNKAKPGRSIFPIENPSTYKTSNTGYIGYHTVSAVYGGKMIAEWGRDPVRSAYYDEDNGESFMIDVSLLNRMDLFPLNAPLGRYINIYICARWFGGYDQLNSYTSLWLEYWRGGTIEPSPIRTGETTFHATAVLYVNNGGVDVNPEKEQTPDQLQILGQSPGGPTFESWVDPNYYAPPTRMMRVRYDRLTHEAVSVWYHKQDGADDHNWPVWANYDPNQGGIWASSSAPLSAPAAPAIDASRDRVRR